MLGLNISSQNIWNRHNSNSLVIIVAHRCTIFAINIVYLVWKWKLNSQNTEKMHHNNYRLTQLVWSDKTLNNEYGKLGLSVRNNNSYFKDNNYQWFCLSIQRRYYFDSTEYSIFEPQEQSNSYVIINHQYYLICRLLVRPGGQEQLHHLRMSLFSSHYEGRRLLL